MKTQVFKNSEPVKSSESLMVFTMIVFWGLLLFASENSYVLFKNGKFILQAKPENGLQFEKMNKPENAVENENSTIQNPALEIEGFLLTMYDARLRLSNQVVEEVKKHFQQMVFETIIQRNIKLSEAPSYGKPVVLYDAASTGSTNYINLAREVLQRNNMTKMDNKEKQF